jgi:LDH2 family malate/lactate/ureidoglycolate dehydrogenase
MNESESVSAAVEYIERELPGDYTAWSIGTISSENHVMLPRGRGCCVTVHAKGGAGMCAVFEKGPIDAFLETARRAVARLKRRMAGEVGA